MSAGRPFDVEHFTYRVIRDAMNEAHPAYWRRRAAAFRAALPTPTVVTGEAGAEKLGERFARLNMLAENCENHANLTDDWLTDVEKRLIHDEFDRCTAMHRYMRHADQAVTFWQLRILWRDAHRSGRLDVQLAHHFDSTAQRMRDQATRDHREALSTHRAQPAHLRGAAA